MLYERLRLIHNLLARDGSIYVHVGWQVSGYVRVILDEIFGKERLKQWCVDASKQDGIRSFRPLLVKEDAWDAYRARSFGEAASTYRAAD